MLLFAGVLVNLGRYKVLAGLVMTRGNLMDGTVIGNSDVILAGVVTS